MKLFSRTSLVALGTAAVVAFSGVSAANADEAPEVNTTVQTEVVTPGEETNKDEEKTSGSSVNKSDDKVSGSLDLFKDKKDNADDAENTEGEGEDDDKTNGSSTDNLDLAGWIKIIAAIFSALTAAVTFASKIGLFR